AMLPFLALFAYGYRRGCGMRRGIMLASAGRWSEACAVLEFELRRKPRVRVLEPPARMYRSVALARLGRHQDALADVELALKLLEGLRGRRRWHVTRTMAGHQHVMVLSALGRSSEARAAFQELPPLAEGADFLEIGRWTAELALEFSEQRCRLSED